LDDGATMTPIIIARKPEKKRDGIWIPPLQLPTSADLWIISVNRSIALAALLIAVTRQFIWCFDDDINGRCWLYTDRRRKCAIRRRIDGTPFKTRDGHPTKAAACPRADVKIPMGYEEAKDFPFFAVAEGGPNGLAIVAQALAVGVEHLVAPIVMPSTGANFTEESLAFLQGKSGRIFIDNDPPGRKAAARWARQLREAGINVDGYSFDGLTRTNGEPVTDINHFCEVDVDSDDKHRNAIEDLMNFARRDCK
jgi:hypothetical protein